MRKEEGIKRADLRHAVFMSDTMNNNLSKKIFIKALSTGG